MTAEGPFSSTLPSRGTSVGSAIATLAFAAIPVFLGDLSLWMIVFWGVLSAIMLAASAIFLLALVAPHRFMIGVAPGTDGFELRLPLRRPRFVRYDEVRRIDVIAGVEGESDDVLGWRLYLGSRKVRLSEVLVSRGRLFETLAARLPIDRAALTAAANYRPRGLEHLAGRRFTIFERPPSDR